ncbi:hypothetical protein [Zhongshania borealis]|uniref:hypothetical protein n=1 Tax=Zhongshania borealis TaxID=889488 RepID=UPI0031E601C8
MVRDPRFRKDDGDCGFSPHPTHVTTPEVFVSSYPTPLTRHTRLRSGIFPVQRAVVRDPRFRKDDEDCGFSPHPTHVTTPEVFVSSYPT